MDKILINKILQAQKKKGNPFEISVVGISMNPTLFEGDIISIQPQKEYDVGDILVFNYKQDELLVHRLLKTENNIYFCKGDNSFRLEDVKKELVIGKVFAVMRNGETISLPPVTKRLIYMSTAVNKVFLKCRYDVETTKETYIYKLYNKIILGNGGRDTMLYKKSESMDYITEDETSLVIFDPESGDTHFIDETGIDILNAIEEPCDLDTVLQKLSEIYSISTDVIKGDVEEFIADLMQKRVVEVL